MKEIIFLKSTLLIVILFIVSINILGQATLPVNATFTTVTTTGAGSMPTGFSQSGLVGYAGALKFDTQGDWLVLYFTNAPGALSFDLGVNNDFTTKTITASMQFAIQESVDGSTWSNVVSYSNVPVGTKNINTLSNTSRYIRWYYSTKSGSSNIALKNIVLAESPNSPSIQTSLTALSGFAYIEGKGPSDEQSFTVGGTKLTNDILITPPADYEISTTSGSQFVASNPISLTQIDGTVVSTTIYTRMKYSLLTNNYTENILLTTINGSSKAINCTGVVTPIPTLSVTDISDPILNSTTGSPTLQTLNVSGVNLSHDLRLSLSGADANLFSLSQSSVSTNNGLVPNTILTITYSPIVSGNHSAILTMSSNGAMDVMRTLHGVATIVTGLNNPQKPFSIIVQNNNLIFMAEAGEMVEVYNSIGQKLFGKLTVDGENSIQILTRGVILVKVGGQNAKVVL